MNLYMVSVIVAVLNPVSAIMLAYMVLKFKSILNLGVFARFFLSLMVCGMLVQAAEQVELLANYRPPRAHGWIATMAALNGVIWTLFIRKIRHKFDN